MIINSRKELKGLLDWYDELIERGDDKRTIITKIYQNYQTTTFNETLSPSPNIRIIQSAIPICPKCKQPTKTLVDCCCNCNYPKAD